MPADSNLCFQQKFPAYQTLSFLLGNGGFQRKWKFIKDVTGINGYSPYVVEKLNRKSQFKRTLQEYSTLQVELQNLYQPPVTVNSPVVRKAFKENICVLLESWGSYIFLKTCFCCKLQYFVFFKGFTLILIKDNNLF